MAEPPHTGTVVDVTDPAAREAIGALISPVIIIEAKSAIATEAAHLGEDRSAWRAFLTETVGGDPGTTYKFRRTGHSYYLNNDDYRTARPERLNPIATMMMAEDSQAPLQYAVAVYGTVVLTGFDFKNYRPRPLSHKGLLAAFESLLSSEHFAQTVTTHLQNQ